MNQNEANSLIAATMNTPAAMQIIINEAAKKVAADLNISPEQAQNHHGRMMAYIAAGIAGTVMAVSDHQQPQ